jgi:DNA-binding transcriptional LysR family regulator
MHVHDLRCFLALAACLDAGEAARGPGTTIPELLAATARLERHFGCRFLDERPAGYRLTPAGRLMVEQGACLLAATDAMLCAVRAAQAGRMPWTVQPGRDSPIAAG